MLYITAVSLIIYKGLVKQLKSHVYFIHSLYFCSLNQIPIYMHKKVHVFWTADDGTNKRITANTTGTKIVMIRVFIHRAINFSSRRSR